jgi:hypothetical protein
VVAFIRGYSDQEFLVFSPGQNRYAASYGLSAHPQGAVDGAARRSPHRLALPVDTR